MSMYVVFACLRTIVIIFYSRYYNPIIGFCLVRQGLLITCMLGLGIHLQQMYVAIVFSQGNFLLF